ncbi:hypothetical protein AVEN_89292-1 [Araneus ventricosus]|uniref:Uncharacterized protein n=1 Tax=Araneus ventricosus TaxID=182803 RepID=A0A4Y2UUX1_ARAVE|nr:hypothetical protein AVEN_89292-1 [Araneus ventricosus]
MVALIRMSSSLNTGMPAVNSREKSCDNVDLAPLSNFPNVQMVALILNSREKSCDNVDLVPLSNFPNVQMVALIRMSSSLNTGVPTVNSREESCDNVDLVPLSNFPFKF